MRPIVANNVCVWLPICLDPRSEQGTHGYASINALKTNKEVGARVESQGDSEVQ